MSIKLDHFDYDITENFYTRNLQDHDFWLFGSFSNEVEKPTSENTDNDARAFLDRTVFGTKLGEDDFAFMIRNIPWTQNRVYVSYDDVSTMSGNDFYVIVEPEISTGEHHVFKCISNNNSAPSISKPDFNVSLQNGIYALPDGYVWKYMGSIPYNLFRKFTTSGYVPIKRDPSVESVANDGIYSILVSNSEENNGYERVSGTVIKINGDEIIVSINEIDSESGISEFSTPDYYKGMTMFFQSVSANTIGAEAFEIASSFIRNNSPTVKIIPTNTSFEIKEGDSFDILPTVVISGNGSGATAVSEVKDGRIIKVNMISYGSGYTRASAAIRNPLFGFEPNVPETRDISAILKVVISPKNGHGSNIYEELKCHRVGISTSVSSIGNAAIPSSGTYSKIGIVKSPSFEPGFSAASFDNRVVLTTDENNNAVAIGSIISQGVVNGKIHEKEVIETEFDTVYKFYVSDYRGPYSEEFTTVGNNIVTTEVGDFGINMVEKSPYIDGTGSVLFISDLTPVERTADRFEQIRLVVDF